MWGIRIRDRAWWPFWAFSIFLAVLHLPFVVPLVERGQFLRLVAAVDPLEVSGLLVVLLWGLWRSESAAARAFWGLTAAGYGCWWLAEILVATFSTLRGDAGFHLFVDGLYILLFVSSLAAAEIRPDLGKPPAETLPLKPRIEVAGLSIALLSLALYFVLIPLRLDPLHYRTWVSSSLLYAILDLLVGLRFFQLSRQATCKRWHAVYALIGWTMMIWLLLDVANALSRAGNFELSAVSPWNLLWTLPLLTMAAAACSSRQSFEERPSQAKDEREPEGISRSASPLIVVAFVLPLTHNGLSALGWLQPELQGARDWLVVASLACLGGLLLVEHWGEQARREKERRRQIRSARQDLERSEERFRTLAEATFEGLLIHDGETILDANEQVAKMFGFPLEHVIGARVGDQVAAADKNKVRSRLRSSVTDLTDGPIEIRAYRRDRTPFLAEVRSRDLPSLGDGARVAVLRDISEQRRLEDELRQAQKVEAVGRFAGGISHDFKNLLTVILGTCDVAEPDSFDEDIRQIRRAADQATEMTQQLLAFSRQQSLALEILDINEVMRENEPMLRRLLPESIDLDLDLGAEERNRLRADRTQLVQVILNLTLNARDAMPAGGGLRVATFSSPERGGGKAIVGLEVEDCGEGISPENLSKVFDPFFTTKERGRGTGLGLATVHGIVRQLGGDIQVRSELGVGTCLRIEWPVTGGGASTPAAPRPAESVAAPAVWGDGTILVVEDQEEIRDLVHLFLTEVGFEVICVSSGLEVFEVIRGLDRPIVLLLTDVVLPHIGGPEVAQRLRRKWPGLKTLFMTGYSEGPWIDAIQGQPILPKPFDRRRLLEKVRQVLDTP